MSLDGVILVFVGEKWQNLPFIGKTRILVPVPKVVTGTHSTEGNWYRYQKLEYRYPFTRDGLVPVPNKEVPVPELPATLFYTCCIVKSRISTPIV